MKFFGITPVGAVRRLLVSPSILIVIANPPNTASSIDSHCGSLSTLCQPRAYSTRSCESIARKSVSCAALASIGSDEIVKIRGIEAEGAA
jgi:hypothetical protein